MIAGTAVFTSIYGFGYGRHYFKRFAGCLALFSQYFPRRHAPHGGGGRCDLFFDRLGSDGGQLVFLVVYEHREANVQAGLLYFVMSHIGTAAILFAFLLLAGSAGSE